MTAEGRKARLAQVAAAHAQMIATYLPLATFDPAKAEVAGGDYNLWWLDMDPPPGADAMFHDALAAIKDDGQ